MKRLSITSLCLAFAIFFFAQASVATEKILKMSTTTSTQASGLLDVLLPELEKDTGIKVKVIAKGTGAAIRDGMDGNVDVIFVHAKAREEKFVKEGFGTKRYAVMHNDFVILGPKADPAGIKGIGSAGKALDRVAQSRASFVSRGDDSGTHKKEKELWETAAVDPKGTWYKEAGQGMGPVITMSNDLQGYALADRGTYLSMRDKVQLSILVEGDSRLFNPYGIFPVDPKKHPHANFRWADRLAKWLVSAVAQSLIAQYKIEGEQAFFPEAVAIEK